MTFEITIHTLPEIEESIEEILENEGFEGIYSFSSVKDAFQKKNHGFDLSMNFLTEENPLGVIEDVRSLLLNSQIKADSFSIDFRELEETNWREEWKKFFKPLEIGRKLLILPAWEDYSGDRDSVVRIDPGMAFGTGGHGTTFACLEIMEKTIKGGETVLDFGAGSGILAIAAVKLGAASVDAIEIDPEAVENAGKNILLNECGEQIALFCGGREAVPGKAYDIVLANVTADIIMENLDYITTKITNLGMIILSGVIEKRKREIDSFLGERSIEPKEIRQKGEWFTYLIVLDGRSQE